MHGSGGDRWMRATVRAPWRRATDHAPSLRSRRLCSRVATQRVRRDDSPHRRESDRRYIPRVHRFLRSIALACALATFPVAYAGALPPGPRALEARLYAPCCYGGTLDMHDSELAHELRAEIEERFARGEAGEAIQSDFVRRYGDKVLATRSDRPFAAAGGLLVALLVLVGAGAVIRLRRGSPGTARGSRAASTNARDELDERLDRELEMLDGA